MVVKERMGVLKRLNHPILNIDTTESGIKIITCDHTINNLLKRTKKEETLLQNIKKLG